MDGAVTFPEIVASGRSAGAPRGEHAPEGMETAEGVVGAEDAAKQRRRRAVAVDVLVLNYNGGRLLEECLPSVIAAAAASRYGCRVCVVDNASTDDSLEVLARRFAGTEVIRTDNRGLCSYNEILAGRRSTVAVLLNNDIKLAGDAVDRLVDAVLEPDGEDGGRGIFLAAPLCWLFDGQTYEGLKTAVRWRWGLVQATALFAGHETGIYEGGLTASAGAVMAVDRRKFVELGGFDPLYLPGRLEDLDLAFRAYRAGYRCRYVPQAVAYHRGHATFGAVYGQAGSDRLALRNTLLFQWKNLRHPVSVARHVGWLPVRVAYDAVRAAWQPAGRRLVFTRALGEALARLPQALRSGGRVGGKVASERDFFARFHPRAVARREAWVGEAALEREEALRAGGYPLSRWYLRPAAGWFARQIADTRIRPWHLSAAGLAATMLAALWLMATGGASAPAAGLVLLAWFFDRADGQLARRQGRATAAGAWLDANLDELGDLGLHAAMAAAASRAGGGQLPWLVFAAFVVGKYLFMYGLAVDPRQREATGRGGDGAAAGWARGPAWLGRLYHLPANADVRVHLAAAAVGTGWLTAALAVVAAYYNARWMVRYVLVPRGLAGRGAGRIAA